MKTGLHTMRMSWRGCRFAACSFALSTAPTWLLTLAAGRRAGRASLSIAQGGGRGAGTGSVARECRAEVLDLSVQTGRSERGSVAPTCQPARLAKASPRADRTVSTLTLPRGTVRTRSLASP